MFKGINATKDLANELVTKAVHIKSCYAVINKAHSTRYQELQNLRSSKKGVAKDHSEMIKYYISTLHNKSSAIIMATIHCSY